MQGQSQSTDGEAKKPFKPNLNQESIESLLKFLIYIVMHKEEAPEALQTNNKRK